MNQIKIGKFILNCRKEKKLTQEQLAEKLGVTSKSISRWENGNTMPDYSLLKELCNILDINVNELLNGEKINMKNYEKKTEELLLELAKQDEIKNRKLMLDMWILTLSACIFYIGIVALATLTLEDGPILSTVICISTALLVFICFYGLKLETEAGYYECQKCHHRFEEKKYFKTMITPHVGTSRFFKCPKCHKRSWSKKVMSKE